MSLDAADGGSLVRPYAITRGRTRPRVDLAIETLLRTTDRGRSMASGIGAVERHILELAERPMALAEIAARLGMVIGAARVVVGDLVVAGWLDRSDVVADHGALYGHDGADAGTADGTSTPGDGPVAPHTDRSLLERVLDGLNAL